MDPVTRYIPGLKGYDGVRPCAEVFGETGIYLQAPKSLLGRALRPQIWSMGWRVGVIKTQVCHSEFCSPTGGVCNAKWISLRPWYYEAPAASVMKGNMNSSFETMNTQGWNGLWQKRLTRAAPWRKSESVHSSFLEGLRHQYPHLGISSLWPIQGPGGIGMQICSQKSWSKEPVWDTALVFLRNPRWEQSWKNTVCFIIRLTQSWTSLKKKKKTAQNAHHPSPA